MRHYIRHFCAITVASLGSVYSQQTPVVVPETAPVGMSASGTQVLFSQPYCDYQTDQSNQLVTRGIYMLGGSTATPLATLPPSRCTENYFSVSPGLGGFPAGDIYAAAVNPSNNPV